MTEDIKTYMGYLIYPDGRVVGKHGAVRKLSPGVDGRLYFTACHEGCISTVPVHKVVAELYVPNPNGYKFVLHKDGNRQNNSYTNLVWVPDSEKGVGRKSAKRVCKCNPDGSIIKEYLSVTAAAKDNGLPTVTISNYLHKKCRDKRGYQWRFAE